MPKKVESLALSKSNPENILKKREQIEETGSKQVSILERVKLREDAKKIKAEIIQVEKPVQEEDEKKNNKFSKDPSKIRCRNYPSCKKQDCPFVHPTEAVI